MGRQNRSLRSPSPQPRLGRTDGEQREQSCGVRSLPWGHPGLPCPLHTDFCHPQKPTVAVLLVWDITQWAILNREEHNDPKAP